VDLPPPAVPEATKSPGLSPDTRTAIPGSTIVTTASDSKGPASAKKIGVIIIAAFAAYLLWSGVKDIGLVGRSVPTIEIADAGLAAMVSVGSCRNERNIICTFKNSESRSFRSPLHLLTQLFRVGIVFT
jgi:hypothetical protein